MGRYREAKEQLTGFFGGLGGDRTVYGPKDECQKKLNKYKKNCVTLSHGPTFFREYPLHRNLFGYVQLIVLQYVAS